MKLFPDGFIWTIFKNFLSMWKLWLPLMVLGILVNLFPYIFKRLKSGDNKKWFQSKTKVEELRRLSPNEFEAYIAELFTALGYKTQVVGGPHDGGVDVEAEKDGKIFYIQCKKFITQQVPVGAVRDFYGAIANKLTSAEGYFITTNIFTLEAKKFAEDKPIELIDQYKLLDYMKLAGSTVVVPTTKCPQCGGALVERKGPRGKFLGCSNFPKCRYTREISL